MKLFETLSPIHPLSLNQGFGKENTPKSLLSTYQALGLIGHNGWDCKAYHGQPIYAPHDGIAYYEVDGNQGEGVVLRTNDQFNHDGRLVYFKSIFWHLADPTKEPRFASPVYIFGKENSGKGMPMKIGDLIGYCDNTGLSTNDHLHWGIKPIVAGGQSIQDATDLGIGHFTNVEATNGYFGAIDLTPYYNGFFALDAQKVETLEKEIPIVQSKLALLIEAIKQWLGLRGIH